jgi:2-methylisocitrate lyase-like PEP mutase family enzyme
MDLKAQNEKAAGFRGLHAVSRALVLPNASDAASGCIFEEAGFG